VEFVASHWWLWLIIGIGGWLGFFLGPLVGSWISFGREKAAPAVVGFFLGVLCAIGATVADLLFIISIVLNIIDYAKK
jgi:hypothetical protein